MSILVDIKKVKLDLCDYERKANLKEATGIGISKLASKTDLAYVKTKGDNLDVGKLKKAPADLSKLSFLLDNYVIKKWFMINWLSKSMLLIPSTSVLVTKTQYNSDKKVYKKKIVNVDKKYTQYLWVCQEGWLQPKKKIENNKLSVTSLVTAAALNIKATGIESEIRDITNLATKAASIRKAKEIENKIHDTAGFIKKIIEIY